jgi:cytochrome bd-type quinol oxidase subunit 2
MHPQTSYERETLQKVYFYDAFVCAVLAGGAVGYLYSPSVIANPEPLAGLVSLLGMLWLGGAVYFLVASTDTLPKRATRLRQVTLWAIGSAVIACLGADYRILKTQITTTDVACFMSAVLLTLPVVWAYWKPEAPQKRLRKLFVEAIPVYFFAVIPWIGLYLSFRIQLQ